nr:MAG TPA: hypothetical protein [Caudoviricetes sp.]
MEVGDTFKSRVRKREIMYIPMQKVVLGVQFSILYEYFINL